MISEQMRRLLAGYATNTLTEAERKALLQASLEDQELFNALHAEQALKDLLDDPASRAEIRQALDRAAPDPPPAWWTRWPTWTAVAAAVAAAVVVVTVVHQQQPISAPQIASVRAPIAEARKPLADATAPDMLSSRRDAPSPPPAQEKLPRVRNARAGAPSKPVETAPSRTLEPPVISAPAAPRPANETAAPIPPPPSPEVAHTDTAARQQAEIQAARDRNQSAELQTTNSAVQARFISPPTTDLMYAIVRLSPNGQYQNLGSGSALNAGDSVRLTVKPAAAGYLTLSLRDASGNWNRIYPASGPGLEVAANTAYLVPDEPIAIQDTGQWYRLTLASPQAKAVTGGSVQSLARTKAKLANSMKKEAREGAQPITVDLMLGPAKVP